jgi:hypothetical protein
MKVCAVFDQYSEKDIVIKKELADYYVNSISEVFQDIS